MDDKCPYCGKPMAPGFIDSMGGARMLWLPDTYDKRRRTKRAVESVGGFFLGTGYPFPFRYEYMRENPVALLCRSCHVLITPLKE